MKNWQITGFLAILIIGFLVVSGCTSTTSGQAKTGIIGQSTTPPQISDSSSCFKFSNLTTSETPISGTPSGIVYFVNGIVTNTCMKNFDAVCIRTTFYDNDNMEVESKKNFISPLQHGTTGSFTFWSGYQNGGTRNRATNYKLEAYPIESDQKWTCL